MKKNIYKKKAIAPLIATILIIVVAVILVTIILTWGKFFTTDSLSKANIGDPTPSDAQHYIFSRSLKNGIFEFSYSPSGNIGDITLQSYTVISDGGEQGNPLSYTIKQGSNYIDLNGFSKFGIPSGSKVTLNLYTDTNHYISITNIISSITETPVNLPYTMWQGRKLYIQPSGSASSGGLNYTEDCWHGYCDREEDWESVKEYCENLDAHGYDDWYLPSVGQLRAIWADDCITLDCINEVLESRYDGSFVPLIGDGYWSSTEYSASDAYGIDMSGGRVYDNFKKHDGYFVRCVRDP